jgi:acetylornithine deacetylase/succinyl-diaminopimelate desuccinylase-like protein
MNVDAKSGSGRAVEAVGEMAIHHRPVELLQRLIRFDTSNLPGREGGCIDWVQQLLEGSGCNSQIVAQEPERPNLVARLLERMDKASQ